MDAPNASDLQPSLVASKDERKRIQDRYLSIDNGLLKVPVQCHNLNFHVPRAFAARRPRAKNARPKSPKVPGSVTAVGVTVTSAGQDPELSP